MSLSARAAPRSASARQGQRQRARAAAEGERQLRRRRRLAVRRAGRSIEHVACARPAAPHRGADLAAAVREGQPPVDREGPKLRDQHLLLAAHDEVAGVVRPHLARAQRGAHHARKRRQLHRAALRLGTAARPAPTVLLLLVIVLLFVVVLLLLAVAALAALGLGRRTGPRARARGRGAGAPSVLEVHHDHRLVGLGRRDARADAARPRHDARAPTSLLRCSTPSQSARTERPHTIEGMSSTKRSKDRT